MEQSALDWETLYKQSEQKLKLLTDKIAMLEKQNSELQKSNTYFKQSAEDGTQMIISFDNKMSDLKQLIRNMTERQDTINQERETAPSRRSNRKKY
jgi:ppGpp synthetase/RelA/SpoT-type nucleotidyltranferase